MKLLDKLKNALFEEEYVEVEERPKRKELKKEKQKKEIKREIPKEEKPIAKKIIQPEIKEPEIIEEKEENVDEYLGESLAIDDSSKRDFKFPMVSDSEFDTDEILDEPPKKQKKEKKEKQDKKLYQGKKRKESKPYGLDEIEIPEHEYGAYEKKEERTYFKPSPIISPIYGILDKNYTKDEIVQKKEIRLTSSYARENINVDDVRRKAFGTLADDIALNVEETTNYEDDYELEDDNQLLDLRSDSDTPEIKKVTMGDAEEYFEDLGLEYNVDYKDTSKEKATGRRTKGDYEEEIEDVNEPQIIEERRIDEEITDEEPENYKIDNDNDEDNLFDLIDSMYDKE